MTFAGEPMTVAIARRVRPSHREVYESWLRGVQEAARSSAGYLGAEVIRPHGAAERYTTILRFSDLAALERWEGSAVRAEWMARFPVEAVLSDAVEERRTGVEYWFTADGAPAAAQPVRWRMALVMVVVVFTLILTLGPVVGAVLGRAPAPVRLLVTVMIEVALMTWVLLPRITRVLGPWLYARPRGA